VIDVGVRVHQQNPFVVVTQKITQYRASLLWKPVVVVWADQTVYSPRIGAKPGLKFRTSGKKLK
jgi:hypothetical protein